MPGKPIRGPREISEADFEKGDFRARWDRRRDKDGTALSLIDKRKTLPLVGHQSFTVTATL